MTRKYNQYSNEFKQTVCEHYSNHTWRVTAAHFDMNEDLNTKGLFTRWYSELGFLPKSAGRNPSMSRVKPTVSKGRGRGKAGVLIKSGGYIFDNKFYGKAEFLELKGVLNSDDTFYTVVESRAGDVISDVAKPNVLTKLFSKFM
jgi:hypothetical protein|tara:strand:+ start:517 stop:948 length:432 start_codon:yes stop_codon:yes gene_type:complete